MDNLFYLTDNILPQYLRKSGESGKDPWTELEDDLRKLVDRPNNPKELYIVAGRDGELEKLDSKDGTYEISVPSDVWKLVLVVDPGQEITDITPDTLAFGVYIANDSSALGRDWKLDMIPVDDLEEITQYDFLNNIPQEIQNVIEARPYDEILQRFNSLRSGSSTASLLANNEIVSGTSLNTSISHSSVPKEGIVSIDSAIDDHTSQIGIFQIGSFQNGTSQISLDQDSTSQISTSQVSPTQISISDKTISESSSSQVGFTKISATQPSASQIGTKAISTSQIRTPQVSTEEIGSSQIDSSQISTIQGNPFIFATGVQIDSSEVTLPRSVPSQQFFSSNFPSHNSTPQIINRLNNSATKIWSDLLQSDTQLDIDFQITDLPTGQLAEATITDFNENGVPNAGTILIDHDANGVGWFIDETPLNNSEFTVQDTDSYLLAATESEASGKYDLLTTVLHELAHLYGFIDGYQGFDANIEIENGTTKFIGDDFEAILDGEHLDKEAHPYDLLNTHLAPGVRKLPSELNVQILQAILAHEDGGTRRLGDGEKLDAALTSDPLLAIANGDFSISDTTTDSFAWDTRGASGIEDSQAVLMEDSLLLKQLYSNLYRT